MDKKEQIIDVATKLFSERGYENTPLSAVCEVANVSKGLIFHHFKSKNDLLREIFSNTTKLIVDINQSSSSKESPKEKLKEIIESVFRQLEADKLFFQLNLSLMLQPSTRDVLNDLIKERSNIILDSTKLIFSEIDSKNAEVLSYMFIAELDGIALNYLCIFENYPLRQIKKQILDKYT
ncbi:TetR/AcrR family transcriptional regulator [Flavobacteriaceae bacterium S0825]|uniref:TetR/AcrR family transcriptional regulator n=1 Tax=Gaetbulibacter sp. S0825 TaxID=2720084 RepID=UPI0014322B81|nr:TetR/AcrR family transcriptional regulator [Gaetbulibacter sp. S0825]MCK0109524.1 TetR/AcrR family transcriptional regulator [Flavobacteriaceae bacterium S0825]NIX65159.1 TetR/AcrR family transcriptional regulator [Gaetbulibacter sp. S0825]